MAKKARFFRIEARNGHGPYKLIIPAQSQADLMNTFSVPANEALLGVTNLDFWLVLDFYSEEYRCTYFVAEIMGHHVEYWPGNPGYHYLSLQFSSRVLDHKKMVAEHEALLRQQYGED